MSAELQSEVKQTPTFADRMDQLLERVEYRRMETGAELDAILRLRYEAYLNEGAITPNQACRLPDAFDDVDNVYNFGIFIDGQLASALRLHRVSHVRQKSPALETFGDMLIPELRKCKLILDPNRFVADYELARLYPGLPDVTLRVGIMACVHFGIDLATMTVRAEHHAFYKRAFFAYPVCPPREYPLLSKPIGLLFLDFVRDADRIFQRRPYWLSSEAERQALFGKGPTSLCSRGKAISIVPALAPANATLIRMEAQRANPIASPPLATAR
jgi:hypothetical protein